MKDKPTVAKLSTDELREELIDFLKEYHTSMFVVDLQNMPIDFGDVIDEYLASRQKPDTSITYLTSKSRHGSNYTSRPDSKVVTDEMIEKWARKEWMQDAFRNAAIEAAKALRDGLIK